MPDAGQQELLFAFVEEGNEMLDESEPLLIELESLSCNSGEVDADIINTIFRLFHSLKGGAGFLNLDTVQSITHEAETLLDLFRRGNKTISSEHIDLLTSTCDIMRKILINLETTFSDAGFEAEAAVIIKKLQTQIQQVTSARQNAESNEDVTSGQSETPVADELRMEITPDMLKQFTAEAEDLLAVTEEAFLILDKQPDNQEYIAQAFRSLHSFKGNAGFFGYPDLVKLSHEAETVLDKIRIGEISGNSKLFSLLLNTLDFLRDGISQIIDGREPMIMALPGLCNLIHDTVQKAAKPEQRNLTGDCLQDSETTENVDAAEQENPENPVYIAAQPMNTKTGRVVSAQPQSIRVDVEKLESLLDLVGELVIAEAMVSQNPDLQQLDVSLERFERAALHLNKITRDLQDIATSIRMVPLSATFKRMIRLVRDVAQKTGKKVKLEITGEETEVDKNVIEKITDPLVHIIRNAIDHGIGEPGVREKAGKPATGHLFLAARYVGREVWITVRDDGKGLDRVKILAKAMKRGLIEANDAELSDTEVRKLIFQPGFSTAEAITDVSGRGVGMDVVRKNIESIGGKVNINSEKGYGTEVELKIPLTLAIIDGMTVRIGSQRYIIPITAIKETIRTDYNAVIRTMDGQEIINIRGNLLPVVRLHDFYQIEPQYTELPDGIIIIVENAGRELCLFVDELIGQQQIVIKGLSDYIGNIKAISGCTILGDGTVCLIVDVGALADIAETQSIRKPISATVF